LVTLFSDASRLNVHSAFCLGETALDIEGVLKQALLRRGIPDQAIKQIVGISTNTSIDSACTRWRSNRNAN
jgi:hypothetical protein